MHIDKNLIIAEHWQLPSAGQFNDAENLITLTHPGASRGSPLRLIVRAETDGADLTAAHSMLSLEAVGLGLKTTICPALFNAGDVIWDIPISEKCTSIGLKVMLDVGEVLPVLTAYVTAYDYLDDFASARTVPELVPDDPVLAGDYGEASFTRISIVGAVGTPEYSDFGNVLAADLPAGCSFSGLTATEITFFSYTTVGIAKRAVISFTNAGVTVYCAFTIPPN